MSGYTPLFSSLTTGTLCGRWPDIGLWPIVLSLSDKRGEVDVTPMYLAGVTGLPVAEVIACMKRFCEPDPYSRTETAGGARLTLLDDHREWGWRIVNHVKYREKARKQAQQTEKTDTGEDAARKAAEREKSGEVPRSPAMSSSVRPSDADADADAEIHTHTRETEFSDVRAAYPKFSGRQDWLSAQHHCNLRIEQDGCTWRQLRDAATRYAQYCASGGVTSTQYVMTPAKFFSQADKPWQQPWDAPRPVAQPPKVVAPSRRAKTVAELEAEEAARHAQH